MSDYNKFSKGNKMKEELDRNANFVLLVISEKTQMRRVPENEGFCNFVLFSKTNLSFSQRSSNVIMYDLLSMIFFGSYKGSSYAGVETWKGGIKSSAISGDLQIFFTKSKGAIWCAESCWSHT